MILQLMRCNFKISKTDFLYEFRVRCKRQNTEPDTSYMNTMNRRYNLND